MPLLETIIGAGSGLIGGTIDAISAANQNRKSQEFSREMYDKQYADNLRFWGMQNEYNSPQNQAKRLQEAGINKNVLAGAGLPGNAGPVQTPDVQPAQFRTPEWGKGLENAGLTYMNSIYDLQIKQAQAKQIEAQTQVTQEDAILRKLQQLSTMAGTERTKKQTEWSVFDLGLAQELRETSADYKRELLRQLKTNIDLSINKDSRESLQTTSNIKEAAERMLNMKSQRGHTVADTFRIRKSLDIMDKDGTLKDIEIQLRKKGINPNDPQWTRMLSMFFDDMVNNPQKAHDAGKKFLSFLKNMLF